MTYLADPGGRFTSDTHRRVLGHLPYPDDAYGWTAVALLNRMGPDIGTDLRSVDEVQAVLEDLEADGHAAKLSVQTPQGDQTIWRMAPQGFETLQMGIPNEPGPDATAEGPAMIGAAPQNAAIYIEPPAPEGGDDAASSSS